MRLLLHSTLDLGGALVLLLLPVVVGGAYGGWGAALAATLAGAGLEIWGAVWRHGNWLPAAPADRAALAAYFAAGLGASVFVGRLHAARQRPVPVDFSVLPVPTGRYLIASASDLSKTVQAGEQVRELSARLEESEQRYRQFAGSLPAILFTAAADGSWDFVAGAWTRCTGLEAQQARDYGWTSVVHPDDVQGALYRWMEAVAAGKPFVSELRFKEVVRGYTWFLCRAVPLRDERGQVVKWFGFAVDIDEQKRLEHAARAAEARLRLAQETAGVAIVECHVQTRQLRRSEDWLRLHGIDPAPAVPFEHWLDAVHPDDRERVDRELRSCWTDAETHEFEYRVGSTDSGVRWIGTRAACVFDDAGNPALVFGASMDITARTRVEEALRSKQKLESIGVLAGGIAHDFNNLLTGIMGNCSLAMEVLSTTQPMVESVLKASERAADLTRHMLAFAGKARPRTQRLDLSELAGEVAAAVQPAIPVAIRLERELAPNLPAIDADPEQVRQVITSLLTNAVEAIGDHTPGTVVLATRFMHVDAVEIAARFTPAEIGPADYVVLEVRDTGCGMDELTRARVFDPFFTTKFPGRGLGLSAVLGIVRGHKGALHVASEPGKGSSFTALFPVSEPAVIQAATANVSALAAAPGPVLVVDDEDIVRETCRRALERHGYSVLLAAGGSEAVELFSRLSGEVALVLLDLAMPEMGGEEVLRRLKQLKPDVQVALLSGYSEEEARRRCRGEEFAAFIEKPFTAAALAARVESILGLQRGLANGRPANGAVLQASTAAGSSAPR